MCFDRRQLVRVMRRLSEAVGCLELGLAGAALRALGGIGEAGPLEPSVAIVRNEAERMLAGLHRVAGESGEAGSSDGPVADGTAWLVLSWCLRQAGQLNHAIDSLGRARGASFPTPWLPTN